MSDGRLLIQVIGLQRSGNHAIICWLESLFARPLHLNDLEHDYSPTPHASARSARSPIATASSSPSRIPATASLPARRSCRTWRVPGPGTSPVTGWPSRYVCATPTTAGRAGPRPRTIRRPRPHLVAAARGLHRQLEGARHALAPKSGRLPLLQPLVPERNLPPRRLRPTRRPLFRGEPRHGLLGRRRQLVRRLCWPELPPYPGERRQLSQHRFLRPLRVFFWGGGGGGGGGGKKKKKLSVGERWCYLLGRDDAAPLFDDLELAAMSERIFGFSVAADSSVRERVPAAAPMLAAPAVHPRVQRNPNLKGIERSRCASSGRLRGRCS